MTPESIRLDKWLWRARFFKSRAIASKLCAAGRVRIDREVTTKAHAAIRVGQVLTFPQARDIRVVRVVALGTRRGPAAEARTLYDDLVADETRAGDHHPGNTSMDRKAPQ